MEFMQGVRAAQAQMQAIGPVREEPTGTREPVLVDNGAEVDIDDPRAPDDANDEFYSLIDRRNAALAAGGGDDLTRDAILMHQDREHNREVAAATNPVSAVGQILGSVGTVKPQAWNTSAPFITPDPLHCGNQPVQVARWDGPDTETRAVACAFQPTNLLNPTILGSGSGVRAYGIVAFGSRLATQTVEVDIGNGCSIMVFGSSVQLSIALDPMPTIPTAASFASNGYQAVGSFSFSSTGKGIPSVRTRYIDTLTNGQTANMYNIPPYARNVTMWRAPNTSAVTLTFVDTGGNTLYTETVAAGSDLLVDPPIPLSGDVAGIQVLNGGPNTLNFIRLIFQLSL